jgi:diguanylate cyclase (GGDEF)-like protein
MQHERSRPIKLKKMISREQRRSFFHLIWQAALTLYGWWSRLSSPEMLPFEAPFAQKEAVRRGQLTSKVILILLSVGFSYLPVAVLQHTTTIVYLAILAFLILAAPLNRRGKSTLAGFIVMMSIELGLIAILVTFPGGLSIIILPMLNFLIVPTLLAASLLPLWTAFPLALGNIGVIFGSVFLLPKAPDMQQVFSSNAGSIVSIPILLQCIIAGISFLWVRGSSEALREANRADILDRLYQEQAVAARTDALTGLLNHRAILQQIEETLVSCQATQGTCAIIFVDVDHFKHINDTWGHGAGDVALCTVGQCLREGIRKEDSVGRYGGEEFIILLSETNQQETFELAERLRYAIAETPCLWQQEETRAVVSIPLTASFGLAAYPFDGLTKKELLVMADSAMYAAKHSGRNRVCLPTRKSKALFTIEDRNEESPQQIEDTMLQTLSTVAAFRDQATQAHADRMVTRAEATMRALGRPEEEVMLLHLATQLHDIGKIGVPDAILHKPGSLTEDEWEIMHLHPTIGQQILTQAKGQFGLISHIVVAHHERWDGQGYPYRLKQEEIPLGARILSVIDSYDAMTSSRPYRDALSAAEAQKELQCCAGTQFDPHVVATFLQVLQAQEQEQKESGTTQTIAAQPFSPAQEV